MRKFKKRFYPIILAFVLILNTIAGITSFASGIPTIYIVGDSLAADYDSVNDFPRQGWGYYFKELVDGAEVINAAESGEDTKTCYTSGRFEERVYSKLRSGDYVLINLGTNDSDEKRGISLDLYAENLLKFASDIKSKGAYPVFVTPPTGHAYEWTRSWSYVQKMKEVANNKNIPLIDLNTKHNAYVKSMVPEIQHGDLLPESVLRDMHVKYIDEEWNLSESEMTQFVSKWGQDTVHFNVNGAEKLASWIADLICESDNSRLVELASYINKSKSVKDGVTVTFEDVKYSKTDSGYKVDGTIRRRIGRGFEPITLFFAAYSENGSLKGVSENEVEFIERVGETDKVVSGFAAYDFSLEIECEKDDKDILKTFVWDSAHSLVPQHDVVEELDTTLNYTQKANGVVLEWDSVEGVESYNVYRDGAYIGTVNGTVFIDKYFDTIEQMLSEDKGLMADIESEHTYNVTAGNKISKSVQATANPDLIKYITFDDVENATTVDGLNNGSNGIKLLVNKDRLKLVKKMNEAKSFTTSDGTAFTTAYYAESYPHIANPYVEFNFTDKNNVSKNALALFTSSSSSDNSANVEKYNAAPWFQIDSFGDTTQNKYTVLLNASINYDEPFSIPKITKRSTDNYLTAMDITGNKDRDEKQISVISSSGSRDSISAYTLYRNNFKPGKYTGEFATYIFDLYASIGENGAAANGGPTNGTTSNLQLFKENDLGDYAFIHSLAIVRSDDFIRETVEYNKLPQVYLVGDSIVATWPEQWYPQQGWGYDFKRLFNDEEIVVNNVAVAGQSARSYYHQYYDSKFGSNLKQGDFVLISFGTNDASHSGTYTYDGQTWNIMTPVNEYGDMLETYIEKIREKGAYPIFVTIANNGNSYNSNATYVEEMRNVASTLNVPCIDLNKMHNDYMKSKAGNAINDVVRRELFMYDVKNAWKLSDSVIAAHPNSSVANGGNDLTHTNKNGSSLLANMILETIQTSENTILKDLANYIRIPEEPEFKLTVTEKANGVTLRWDEVSGVTTYDVYRDDVKIATVTDSTYDDIYFNSVEELKSDTLSLNNHSYYVIYGEEQKSEVVTANANTSLIKYITFDNATYSVDEINAGANGLFVSTKDANNNPLILCSLYNKPETVSAGFTTKYISRETYSKWNEVYVGDFGGKNALGLVRYQYNKKNSDGSSVVTNSVTRPVLDMSGFESQDDYTIIMNANIMVDDFTIAGVEESGAESFAYKTISGNKITVVGGEDIAVSNGVFNPGVNKNKFATYIYDMNTKFDGKYGDMRFSNTATTVDETAAIRSMAVVKKSNYIMPREKTTEEEFGLTVTPKANGVILNWNEINGIDSYEVYKDNEKIAEVTETEYVDIYYGTIEGISSAEEHEYYIKASEKESGIVNASADLSLIKYITFDNATYSANGINAGANGLFVATKDADGNDLSLYSLRARTSSDSQDYTSKYISTMTYRKWNEVYVGNLGGKNALGLVSYQYKKNANGTLTLDAVQPTRPILNMNGFESQDTYTIIMNANVMVDNFTVAGVETDNTKDSFADKNIVNNKVTVLGGEDITVSNGVFNPGVNKNKFVTYIYDMNTKFDGKYGDMRFSNTVTTVDETAAIRSMAVVKKSDFIMPDTSMVDEFNLTATKKANGVILNWEEVDTSDNYEVYKDGEKIATVDENQYVDVYYTSLEDINDISAHKYYIKAGDKKSAEIKTQADLSLIKYITFDDATYSAEGINAGANGISVATKDADGNDLALYKIRNKLATDTTAYTSKYISTMTYRKYNEVYVGDFGGQNALGMLKYQYNKKNSDGSSTITTDATRAVLDMSGFEAQNTYTIIMNANIMVDSFTVAGVETDSTKDSFADKNVLNDTVSVAGGEDIAVSNGVFNPGANKNKFATYIYDMNTKFNGKYGDIRFSNTSTSADETIAVRSFGVVKKSDFLIKEAEKDDFELTKLSKANGVILNWQNVDDADSYDVYRDDEKVATVTGNQYVDIYYNTIEDIKNITTHKYYVKTADKKSSTIKATADLSLIKYITFDDATYTADGINAGANGLSVSLKDANGNDLSLYSLRGKTQTDSTAYTSKYISTMTYRKYNEAYVDNFDGQNALGVIRYQYNKKNSDGSSTITTDITRPILELEGFEEQDVYTVIMNANIMADSFTVPGVESDGGETFSDKSVAEKKVLVVGGETIATNSGAFDPGVNKNKYTTYIYDMNTKFDGSYGDIRFSNASTAVDETAAIRSIGVVKKSDFIYDYVLGTNSEKIYKNSSIPVKCSSGTYTDEATGNTVNYMNVFGLETVKPYVTQQAWTSDGNSFILALKTGEMFIYNVETQMLKYIDTVITDDIVLNGTVGPDDSIYYVKKPRSYAQLWKYDIATGNKELIVTGKYDSAFYFPHISNDLKYLSVEYSYPEIKDKTPREYAIARLDLETKEFEIATHSFDYSNVLNHVQVNPQYTDLMFFAHEYDDVTESEYMLDRVWTYDFSTGEKKNIFKQGVFDDGRAMQQATHEVWSRDGEYLYLVVPEYEEGAGKQSSVVRIDKDGRHRQYYYYDDFNYDISHCSPTADNKFIFTDGDYLTIISTETNEIFSLMEVNLYGNSNRHPYHPHPIVAPNDYKAMWGMVNENILGIAWLDFSYMENQVAKGSRIDTENGYSILSYPGLDCEVSSVEKDGRNAFYVKKGNSLYIDIDDEILDTTDAKIKVSFDYYDSGFLSSFDLSYTSGVKSDNDYWKLYDAKETIMNYSFGGEWKNKEITIDSGNFENAGTYYTDLKFTPSNELYISNVTITVIE